MSFSNELKIQTFPNKGKLRIFHQHIYPKWMANFSQQNGNMSKQTENDRRGNLRLSIRKNVVSRSMSKYNKLSSS